MEKVTLFETPNSSLWMVKDYYPMDMETLEKLPLEIQPEIVVYGRVCKQRRNVGFFSDVVHSYPYSHREAVAKPLTEELREVMKKVNEDFGYEFNAILVNQYLTGDYVIGAHFDDSRTLSANTVVGISFGATRTFRIRNKETKKIVYDHNWESGSLVAMSGDFQKEFTHEIPQQKKVKEARISLTFRKHVEK